MKLLRVITIPAAIAPTAPSEVHGPEGQGGESGESGTQYALSETATEVSRRGQADRFQHGVVA